jgi:VanZ family protein
MKLIDALLDVLGDVLAIIVVIPFYCLMRICDPKEENI